MGWGVYRLAEGYATFHIPILLTAVFIGYLAADFVSGLVHWLADRYFSPDTPVIGSTFIVPHQFWPQMRSTTVLFLEKEQ